MLLRCHDSENARIHESSRIVEGLEMVCKWFVDRCLGHCAVADWWGCGVGIGEHT